MATLYIERRDEYLDGSIKGCISQPILSGTNLNINLKPRVVHLGHDSEGASQEISAFNQALIELASNSDVNKENIPELLILKSDNRDFSQVAKEAMQELENRGIALNVRKR